MILSYSRQAEISARMLAASPSWRRLCELGRGVDAETLEMILAQAAGLAEEAVAPINVDADRIGCRLENGRVITPPGFREAWRAVADAGWLAGDLPEEAGGMGLPLAVHTAAQTLFDRACPAFVMLGGATRGGAFVLLRFTDEAMRGEWVPRLASGEWSATICISEPGAGSDVGRIRTRAAQADDGSWRISGQKCWISFGDHDMTDRIGHLCLARTGDPASGTRGLSLFLVPSVLDDGTRNRIAIERIEHKLGLHGSPTCVMQFEDATGYLIGSEGRGLSHIFVMIERMRLSTAGQGVGAASAALDIGLRYAQERRQGGSPAEPPVVIAAHPDVKRQLAVIESRTEVVRAFLLELGVLLDLAAAEDDAELRALVAWLMPLAKNFGAETAFEVASGAIQILGGAGYTNEWPAEQILRDTRILSIFEGTTGIQALDLLHRRLWGEEAAGLHAFLGLMKQEAETVRGADAASADLALSIGERFESLAGRYAKMQERRVAAEAGADPFMRAAWAAARAWMALRLICMGGEDETGSRLAALGRFALLEAEADLLSAAYLAEHLPNELPAELYTA